MKNCTSFSCQNQLQVDVHWRDHHNFCQTNVGFIRYNLVSQATIRPTAQFQLNGWLNCHLLSRQNSKFDSHISGKRWLSKFIIKISGRKFIVWIAKTICKKEICYYFLFCVCVPEISNRLIFDKNYCSLVFALLNLRQSINWCVQFRW